MRVLPTLTCIPLHCLDPPANLFLLQVAGQYVYLIDSECLPFPKESKMSIQSRHDPKEEVEEKESPDPMKTFRSEYNETTGHPLLTSVLLSPRRR